MTRRRPVIGITPDIAGGQLRLRPPLPEAVGRAGGTPIVLPCLIDRIPDLLDLCDGFILSGGDDPIMERWGVATHPKATPIDPVRQDFELALLEALDARPAVPLLGVCLGMQLMGLHAGGALDQHLPDSLPTAADHWDHTQHEIEGELGTGVVHSHHRQALTDAGTLRVVATAPDGVIEAIRADAAPFRLGVQWHPERTDDPKLGAELFAKLIDAAGGGTG
jgi:putative glutamine amidotransferase